MKTKMNNIKLIYKVGVWAVNTAVTAAAVGIVHYYQRNFRDRWVGYYINDSLRGWKSYLKS